MFLGRRANPRGNVRRINSRGSPPSTGTMVNRDVFVAASTPIVTANAFPSGDSRRRAAQTRPGAWQTRGSGCRARKLAVFSIRFHSARARVSRSARIDGTERSISQAISRPRASDWARISRRRTRRRRMARRVPSARSSTCRECVEILSSAPGHGCLPGVGRKFSSTQTSLSRARSVCA